MTEHVPDGFVLVDKPAGISSHTAVQQVRRALGIGGRRGRKAGHAGTLDPFATGLLIVLVGRATRLMPWVVGCDKRYLVDVRLGASSDTDDLAGGVELHPGPLPSRAQVEAALPALAAATTQVPPAVSAIHVDGERAYRRVRRGEQVQVAARAVRIDSIRLVGWEPAAPCGRGPLARLDVRCGSGVYMRALARDLGAAVGSAGYCEALRRSEVGDWLVDAAVAPEAARAADVRDAAGLVTRLASVVVAEPALRDDIAHGRRIPLVDAPASWPVALLDPDGALLAVGEPHGESAIQPRMVLLADRQDPARLA